MRTQATEYSFSSVKLRGTNEGEANGVKEEGKKWEESQKRSPRIKDNFYLLAYSSV
jgi:hypothetical protein